MKQNIINNHFDNFTLDILALKNKVLANNSKKTLHHIFPMGLLLFNVVIHKLKISEEFVYSYLLTNWFQEFRNFWSEIMDGRPLDIIDFHFLRLSYRNKFQNVKHFNEPDNIDFLTAWHSNENMYLLFGSIWKYAKSAYLNFLAFYFELPKKGKILEYGCGIAPITTGILKYFPSKKYAFEICDILQINFLYAIYNLSNRQNVKYHIMSPYNNLIDKNNYSVIICQTVLEHIPNPLEVVKSFYDGLEDEGILVFDYIKGDGSGLDSKKSVEEREKTLKFIKNNFFLIKGKISFEKSVGLCIVKKLKT